MVVLAWSDATRSAEKAVPTEVQYSKTIQTQFGYADRQNLGV